MWGTDSHSWKHIFLMWMKISFSLWNQAKQKTFYQTRNIPIPPPACGGQPYRKESMYASIFCKSILWCFARSINKSASCIRCAPDNISSPEVTIKFWWRIQACWHFLLILFLLSKAALLAYFKKAYFEKTPLSPWHRQFLQALVAVLTVNKIQHGSRRTI